MPPTKLPTSNLEALAMTVSDFDVAVTGKKEILEVVTVTFTYNDVTDEAVVDLVWLVSAG